MKYRNRMFFVCPYTFTCLYATLSFGRKLTLGDYIIGVLIFLDHLASNRDWKREESQVRIFVSSAPSLQGHLELALSLV